MKIIGIVILCVSIFLFGILFNEKYKTRYKSLCIFYDILNSYAIELKLHRKTISDIIYHFNNNSNYFNKSKTLISTNTIIEAMITQNNYFNELMLSKQDLSIISNFFTNCGKGSYKTELELCTNTLYALEKLKNDAFDSYKKFGPFTVKLSVIASIWIFVILI